MVEVHEEWRGEGWGKPYTGLNDPDVDRFCSI